MASPGGIGPASLQINWAEWAIEQSYNQKTLFCQNICCSYLELLSHVIRRMGYSLLRLLLHHVTFKIHLMEGSAPRWETFTRGYTHASYIMKRAWRFFIIINGHIMTCSLFTPFSLFRHPTRRRDCLPSHFFLVMRRCNISGHHSFNKRSRRHQSRSEP